MRPVLAILSVLLLSSISNAFLVSDLEDITIVHSNETVSFNFSIYNNQAQSVQATVMNTSVVLERYENRTFVIELQPDSRRDIFVSWNGGNFTKSVITTSDKNTYSGGFLSEYSEEEKQAMGIVGFLIALMVFVIIMKRRR